jgi:hypothetical protein
MIKFITTQKEESTILTFQDVDENQFFVSSDGSLCQKMDEETYCTIADRDGDPFCSYDTAYPDDEIQRLIEYIGKIEF